MLQILILKKNTRLPKQSLAIARLRKRELHSHAHAQSSAIIYNLVETPSCRPVPCPKFPTIKRTPTLETSQKRQRDGRLWQMVVVRRTRWLLVRGRLVRGWLIRGDAAAHLNHEKVVVGRGHGPASAKPPLGRVLLLDALRLDKEDEDLEGVDPGAARGRHARLLVAPHLVLAHEDGVADDVGAAEQEVEEHKDGRRRLVRAHGARRRLLAVDEEQLVQRHDPRGKDEGLEKNSEVVGPHHGAADGIEAKVPECDDESGLTSYQG